MKYIVSVTVQGIIDVEVDADSFDEAGFNAIFEAGDCDWNTIEYVNIESVNAEDENGELYVF